MALENNINDQISGLDSSSPSNFDLINEGDDHIRMIKRVLKKTFPSINKPLQATADGINKLVANITPDDSSITILNAVNGVANKVWDLKQAVLTGIKTSTAAPSGSGLTSKDAVNAEYLYNHAAYAAWPIGSLYFNAGAGDPKVLLKMPLSNWVQFGQGRVLIGAGSGGSPDENNQTRTFSVGNAGGAFSHTLTNNEIPLHRHPLTNIPVDVDGTGNHQHDSGWGEHSSTSGPPYGYADASPSHGGSGRTDWDNQRWLTSPAGAHTHGARIRAENTGNQGAGGGAHQNMQPYIAVNIWRRTS